MCVHTMQDKNVCDTVLLSDGDPDVYHWRSGEMQWHNHTVGWASSKKKNQVLRHISTR